MSILDINKSVVKTIIVYFFVSIFTLVFAKIYSIFSHGVYSKYMDLMFLYPLIGGSLIYLIILVFNKNISYKRNRILFNIYNTGIATLTLGSLLHGILEIAGTSSRYIVYYSIIGWIAVAMALASIIIVNIFRKN